MKFLIYKTLLIKMMMNGLWTE